jgi:exodeoxyribonuclease VII large subunit
VSGGSQDIVVSVAELDRRLRRAVEGATGGYWVEGEVSSLKRATSGHLYFTLKDDEEDAIIECVMYRFDALRAQRFIKEGEKLQLFGRVTVWAPRGRLQLVGQRARPAGRGSLLLALEDLKKKLAAEGLFEPARRRQIPADPHIVGVVTSAAGAAFHDIRSVAFRRGSVRLVLSPALVQGDGAPASLVAALDALECYPGLDVVIIGRGGGSGEDLMAFNHESVVRRVAAMRVPVVSGVGHETDV